MSRRLLFVTVCFATVLVASAQRAVAQEIPRIESATNEKGMREQLTKITGAKYACIGAAKEAIDWLKFEVHYLDNVIGGTPSQLEAREKLENDLSAELAKLNALPPCVTPTETEPGKKPRKLRTTNIRPNPEHLESPPLTAPEPVKHYHVGTLRKPEDRIEIGLSPKTSTGPLHPFLALEGGGGWSNANFAVSPPFDVAGSGFVYGINGGVLIDIPGTTVSVGPRIGWQGGNMSGSIANPPASIGFMYDVKTKSVFYQEALVSVPIHPELFGFEKTFLDSGQGPTSFRLPFVTASAGIAEVQTQITGTSGAFQVTDGASQTGFTGTVGIGMPISQNVLGGVLDIYAQYRLIVLPSTTVSIPGQVQIDNRWIQGINFGFEIRY